MNPGPMVLARPVLVACLLLQSVGIVVAQDVDFNADIRPILSDRCFVCHGPDEEAREAELRLDVADNLHAESQSGNAPQIVTPGDAAASELWLRVSSSDPDERMPPPDSNLKLSAAEQEAIRKWIDGGAEFATHWSFQPIAPRQFDGSIGEAIDHYIGKRLNEEGWQLGELAPKHQLMRRLAFDITGLPPTADQLAEFDVSRPDAVGKMVESLLASTSYGERMASIWLDAARYSDTYGYQVDRERFVWPWRDWVIRAFNDNMPFDEFITEQLAGDLIPNATEDQLLATTFNRLHPQKVEGGSVPEEFRIEYVADRTQTFATAMLGLTFECCRCHDHKYDPLSQKEYYQLTAFFDKIDEAGLYSYFTSSIPTPTLQLGSDENEAKANVLRQQIVEAESKLLESLRRSDFDESFVPTIPKPLESLDFDEYKAGGKNMVVDGVSGKAVQLSGDDAVKLKQGNFARYEPFSVGLWLKVPRKFDRAVVFHRSRAWTDAGSRGYQLLLEDGKLSASLIHFWPGNAIRIRASHEFPIDSWQHVVVTYDGSSRANGLRLYLNGAPSDIEIVRDNLYKEIRGGGNDHISIGERFRDIGLRDGVVDEFQIFDRELQAAEIRMLHNPESESGLSDVEIRGLANSARPEAQAAREQLEKLRKEYAELNKSLKEIMVMREMAAPRQTYLLNRGAYDAPGDPVEAGTPSALPPMPESLPRNRLGLAQWMTGDSHPLTARVAVNRIWQMMFGSGLVRTPEDFGSQGQQPTHPELLDWLARDYMENGWDTKRLIAGIVQSRTYRQSSVATEEQLERDPENMLYGRAPSYRLSAEILRDQALASSGLLVEKLGGPPVKPYDLQVSFKPMKPDEGEGLYRRSVYTYWKRTGPAPAMMALDAAKRDVCRVKRSRTASPLQTLVLMNSPQFVEAARTLAESAIVAHDKTEDRIKQIFHRLTSRTPSPRELSILTALHGRQIEILEDESLKAYLSVGKRTAKENLDTRELAALTVVANALFGLDEVMMKR